MRRIVIVMAVLLIGSCSDEAPAPGPVTDAAIDQAAPAPDARPDGGSLDGAVDAAVDAATDTHGTGLTSCLDRPDEELPRPPTARLPCELIPPGLTL